MLKNTIAITCFHFMMAVNNNLRVLLTYKLEVLVGTLG